MTLLAMTRGDTAVFDVTLIDPDGEPLDITDVEVTFTARRYPGAPTAVITKTEGNGVTHTDDLGGLVSITIDPDDTEDLTDLTTLRWDVQLVDLLGAVQTPLSGRLSIAPDITLPVA